MRYSVVTFGCRVNQADSLMMEDALRRRGGEPVQPDVADLVVVNSCSVTASADQGTRQAVRRIVRANPRVQVVVTGCYASRRPDEITSLPNILRVVGNDDKDRFDAILEDLSSAASPRLPHDDGPCGSFLQPGTAGRTALTLRVQTGCDEPCSYCVIPRTRGRGRSRPMPMVIDDIDRAVAAGYKEITITGVHLGSYGRDLGGPCSLTSLIRHLANRPEDVLFRVSSLEPMDCTSEIIDTVAESPRLAPHFHVPLQHGSNRILRAMRRPYTAGHFAQLVERIHAVMPWAAIGSDLIVGFPGEQDEDAERTERLVASLPLSHLHVFPYSDRPGTEASRLGNRADGTIVRERGQRLRLVGAQLARQFRRSQAGTVRRALTVDDGRSAVTDNYLKVPLPAAHARNEWITLQIPE